MTVETTAQTPAQTPVRRTLGPSAALLAVAGLGLAAAPAASAAEGTATADLSVRAETNTGSAVLATIPSGAAVDVQCQAAGEHIDGTYSTDQWGKVTHDGQTGYVSRAYLTILDANGLVACGEGEAPAPTPAPEPGISADRQQVLDRGRHWVQQGLPYSMEAYAPGPDADGYQFRTDCSGMIAMAYNLRDQSYSTVNLPEKFHEIDKNDLQPGDIVGNLGPGSAGANGHVVIFNGWTDESKTTFHTIEQAGGVGATERTATWGADFWNQHAYRLNGW